MYRRACLPLLIGIAALVTGCASKTASFPGRSPDQVWTALVTVSEQPEYEKWVLIENNVWVDSNFDRVEIHRRLRRDIHRVESPVVREDETLEIQFVLERTDPPTITGTVRNFMVRAHALEALDHIFHEMRKLLTPVTLDGASADAATTGGS